MSKPAKYIIGYVIFLLFLIGMWLSMTNSTPQTPQYQGTGTPLPQEIKTPEGCKPDDLQCLVNSPNFHGFSSASVYCEHDIERLAAHSVKWNDGWLQLKFDRARWNDQAKGLITYIGDKVEFQNGFGAFTPMIYECDLDSDNKTVLDVRAREGRLP